MTTADDGGAAALVNVAIDGPVAEIGLDNAPLNLMTRPMLRALNAAIGEIRARDDIRCVILHGGNARAFCAGSDVREFDALRTGASEHKILVEDMMLRNLSRLPMPSIAAIDAPALGGGLELALACDLRVLRRGVSIGLPESRIGGLAGSGSLRLTRLIGPSRAKEMLFTGETISSEQALAWGVVNRVVDGPALDGARALAATIVSRAPMSHRLAKQLVDSAFDVPLDAGLSMANAAQQKIFDGSDLHEGVAAFLAKRPPAFTGR